MQHKDKTQIIKYQIEPHNINLEELNTQFRASTDNQDKQAYQDLIKTILLLPSMKQTKKMEDNLRN